MSSVLALILMVGTTALVPPGADPVPLKVLMVCGGCCHDYQNQKAIISNGLAERAFIEVTVIQEGGSSSASKIPLYEKADWSKGYDLVIHDECFSEAAETSWTSRILNPHKDGLPAVVLHCAMHSYRDGTNNWFDFCGVTSRKHGASYPHEVTNVDPAHEIMKEFGPFWNNPAGELYWIERVHPTSHVLASARNKETGRDEPCVWTNVYNGKARVFGTTLGHHNETVKADAYLDLLTRGILWACNKSAATYLKSRPVKTVRNNLATGKEVSASSEEKGKGNLAAKAIDGDPGTRWCAANAEAGQWIQVDLGKPEPVTGVTIDWESSDAIYRYKVEISADGQAWKLSYDGGTNNNRGNSQLDFDGKGSRYVRIKFLGSNTGNWASITELAVLGDKTTTVNETDRFRAEEVKLLREVKIPAGYDATVFAAPPAVAYPVFVTASPSGDVYVSVDRNGSLDRQLHRGSVVRLRDVDGDGRADESRVFINDVDSPRGLVWDHDRLYLMHPPHLSVFIDKDGDGQADDQRILIKNIAFGFKDRPADHTSNGVTLGIDGWLYLAIGDFGFMEAEGTDGRKLQLRGGGVVRVRPDGTGLEVYSRGTRNILEVSVDPLLNAFARDNTNDGGGWDIRLHHFSGTENHGYPSLFRNFTDEAIAPLADYGGGSGCGGLFLAEPGFPPADSKSLYTADWGRNAVFRHHLKPRGATFEADQVEFLGLTRVTDLDVDAMSRIYASSWRGATFNYAGENVGFLLSLSPKGYKPEPLPAFEQRSRLELVTLLRSPSARRRLEAQRSLLRRGLDPATSSQLVELCQDESAPLEAKVAAIFALKQGLGATAASLLQPLLKRPAITAYVLRALTDRNDQRDGVDASVVAGYATSSVPRDRLQVAISLARLDARANASALVPLLDDSDPVVAHTAVVALVELQARAELLSMLDRSDASSASRKHAIRALQQMHDDTTVNALIHRIDKEVDPRKRIELFGALCRLHDREGQWRGDSWGTRPDTSGPYYQAEPWSQSKLIEVGLRRALERADNTELVGQLRQLGLHKIYLGDPPGFFATTNGLPDLIERARKDQRLVPDLVAQMTHMNTVSGMAAPFLAEVATKADANDELRAQAIGALTAIGGQPGLKAILASLPRFSRSEEGRRQQLRAARDFLASKHLKPMQESLISKSQERDGDRSAWADAALLQLASAGSTEAVKYVQLGWEDPSRCLQLLEAATLSEHRASADEIRKLSGNSDPKVAQAARDALIALKLDQPNPRRAGPTVQTLGIDRTLERVTAIKGDPESGRQLFTRLNCMNCHTVDAHEPPKGPFLGNIAATYKRRELAESILRPSKSLAQGFVTTALALDDGTTVVGFVVKESADAVVLRNAEAKELTIPTKRIEERAKRDVSVMPEGLVNALTPREFASLLDYLESLSKK